MSAMARAPILLVEHDEERSALFGGWLQGAGHEVLTCPGPSAPEYSCIGSRAGHCPLVEPASLVVLDLSFSPEATIRAPIDIDLLGFYLLTGKPIIALGRGDGLLADRFENQLIPLERTPDRGDFLQTVERVIARQALLPTTQEGAEDDDDLDALQGARAPVQGIGTRARDRSRS